MERVGWIEGSDKPAPTRLPCDYTSCRVSVALCGKRRLNAGTIGTSVHIPDFNATLFVHGHIEKVEQIAANVCPAVHPDATALQRIVRSSVGCRPSFASVERIGKIKMPDAVETVCGTISGCRRAIEGHARTTCVACHSSGKGDVL